MMTSKDQIDRLRIATPCPATWQQMKGDERVRFCQLCSLHVYNIAELTAREAKSLIANTEGRICARLYRRSDGTVITKDCPVGLRAMRRRVARIAGAAFATILSLFGGAFGQKANDDKSCRQQVRISRTLSDSLRDYGVVKGTILDPAYGAVPNAGVTLVDIKSKIAREMKSGDTGHFEFSRVIPGVYELTVRTAGFKYLVVKKLNLAAKETANLDAILLLDETTVTVGIVDTSYPGVFDASKPGVMTISGETLRKLPIP